MLFAFLSENFLVENQFIFFYLIFNTIKNNSKIITKKFAYMNNSIYIYITITTK